MTGREPKTVRLDPEKWSQFISWVESQEGQKHGEIGRHVETALMEYIDHGQTARIEEKVDTILARIDASAGSHTHTGSEGVEAARQIFNRVASNHGTVIKDDDVTRAIEDIAGVDGRTIDKYKDILKRRELLFEHPSDSPVWTTQTNKWVEWTENYVDNNPGVSIPDVLEDYGMSIDQYDERVEVLAE